MRSIRRRNPLLFDTLVLALFVTVAFAAYPLVEGFGASGAWSAILLLGVLCGVLTLSQ